MQAHAISARYGLDYQQRYMKVTMKEKLRNIVTQQGESRGKDVSRKLLRIALDYLIVLSA
eukprot:6036907-Pleurochrysis_carterae.AAC.1